MSVGEVAELLSTSKATLVRFSKKLGYEGYGALRMVVARDLGENQHEVYAEVTREDSPAEMVEKTFNHAIGGLRDTLSTIKPDTLLDAAQAIRNAGSLLVIGMGGSGGMAVVAQHRIGRLGILVHVCTDAHTLPVICDALRPHDVVLAITHTGMTEPIIAALADAKRAGASTIAICNNPVSPVARTVDHLLLTGVGPTPIAAEAGSSRIAQAAVIDALTVVLQFIMDAPR